MPAAGAPGWGMAVAAFAAGVASFFSPCVAPLVPGYMSYLAGTSVLQPAQDGGRWRLRGNPVVPVCLLFVGGFSAAFIALGLLAASFGSLLVAYRPVLETIAGIAMLVMGAFLLNLLPKAWMLTLAREWRLPASGRGVGRLAPFGLGVVFAAGWTPCIGPILGSILFYAGASANVGGGVLLLALYSLGFALPFMGIGLGWSEALRLLGWLKRHGNVVTTVSGVALILVGLVYLSGQVSEFSIWAQHIAGPTFG